MPKYSIRVMSYAGSILYFEYLSSVVPRMDDILSFDNKEYKVYRVKYCIEKNARFNSCQEAVIYTVDLT